MEVLDVLEEPKSSSSHSFDVLYKKCRELVELFCKENLDYQLIGKFAVALKYRDEISIDVSTIQIHLNEKDIERFHQICQNLNLHFKDNRLHSPKVLKDGVVMGDAEVVVLLDDIPLLEVFCFERLVDGTIISKEYYQDEEDNSRAMETIYGSKLAKEIYGKGFIEFFGYTIPIISFEYLFLQKQFDDDILEFLETKIENRIVSTIRNLMKQEYVVQFVVINELPEADTINHHLMENDNTDISQMLLAAQLADLSDTQNLAFLEAKQLHKTVKPEEEEEGFSTPYLIIVITLMLFVLGLSGCIIFKLFY